MGSTQSTSASAAGKTGKLQKTAEDIVKLMMPVYYCTESLTRDEHASAAATWQMILNNTAPEFLKQRKENTEFRRRFTTSIMYFSHCFYARLFDIHPMAKELFKDMKSQGKFLVKMISLSLSEMSDADKFEKTLMKLAEIHNDRGVKAVEYGVVGEVLLHAIKKCIGPDSFTPQVHLAWVKIYSRMLSTMVPVAVAHELRDGSAQQKRFLTMNLGNFNNDTNITGLSASKSVEISQNLENSAEEKA